MRSTQDLRSRRVHCTSCWAQLGEAAALAKDSFRRYGLPNMADQTFWQACSWCQSAENSCFMVSCFIRVLDVPDQFEIGKFLQIFSMGWTCVTPVQTTVFWLSRPTLQDCCAMTSHFVFGFLSDSYSAPVCLSKIVTRISSTRTVLIPQDPPLVSRTCFSLNGVLLILLEKIAKNLFLVRSLPKRSKL